MTANTLTPQNRSSALLLAVLHCPYCGSPLEQTHGVEPNPLELPAGAYGILRCGCTRFPVLDGIPILQHIDGIQRVVQYVENRDYRQALLYAMNVFRMKWAYRTRWHQARYYFDCRRLVDRPYLTFEDGIDLVRKPKGFADYLFHRYANPSFIVDMLLMPVMDTVVQQTPQARILDLGCGAGHSSFLLTQRFPGASVIASDQDFVGLYLARRFLAPSAQFVCTDVEVPSPFPADYFDAVHCLDAFHYFKTKQAILGELRRVMKADALWLFPHLHNALMENVTAGIPLAPEHYARCFEFLDVALFDEADLRRSALSDGREDDLHPRQPSELQHAQTLALVGGGAGALLERKTSTLFNRDRSGLRINPIYRASWKGERLNLQMQWPSEELRAECRDAESILPQACEVSRSDVMDVLSSRYPVDETPLADLVRRFVLVPLAPRYCRHDPLAGLAD